MLGQKLFKQNYVAFCATFGAIMNITTMSLIKTRPSSAGLSHITSRLDTANLEHGTG